MRINALFRRSIELRQCVTLFVNFPLYESVSEGLFRALQILK